ncbi:N-acetylmuramoyl-L-alanine amidase [Paenibacillus sp. L3-i20]|uniref:N-acetylmuramoyl-L-alanine amidase family protein n=1 Tax=Paenibacillus sp. L3-i20 TaxID=2905833 RepID=UPI001EDCB0AE|nr:N-acetylmuramoyl-L-alanine amidase [Paenibacillus sp. L3-i20]GKU76360.1 hypothetical protein L3i20_v207570 [Paenibacillus sp. L3-i20]
MKKLVLLFIVTIACFILIGNIYQGKSATSKEKVEVTTLNAKADGDMKLAGKTIVIDPGHGGKDVGASGQNGTIEKDVTLRTAKMIQDEIMRQTGANVLLTRDGDQSFSLQERVDFVSERDADLFISIHYDAFITSDVQGITTFYNKDSDFALADMIHKQLFSQEINTRDRGVQHGDYFVIRETTQPSILLELGYISNTVEEERMNSDEFQQQAAEAITKGIIDYFS